MHKFLNEAFHCHAPRSFDQNDYAKPKLWKQGFDQCLIAG